MTWNFREVFKKFIRSFLSLCLGLLLLFSPFGQTLVAAKASMSGDFVKDTVFVAQSLKETIALGDDDQNLSDSKDQALSLITAYISRYRNRPQVNGTSSFTTMQNFCGC